MSANFLVEKTCAVLWKKYYTVKSNFEAQNYIFAQVAKNIIFSLYIVGT
jgi:hypothetical protein